MRRFLAFWFACAISLFLATELTAWLGFRHIDLRYEAFFALVVIPSFQALVLAAATARRGLRPLLDAGGEAWRHPIVRAAVSLDLILLTAGWLSDASAFAALAALAQLAERWIGVKGLAAGYLLARAALRRAERQIQPSGRGWLLACAAVMWAVAFWTLVPAAASLPDRLFEPLWPRSPTVIRWLATYGCLFGAALAIGLEAAVAAGRRVPATGPLIETALGLAGLAALVVVLNIFLRPSVPEPWRGVALCLVSLCTSLFLVVGLMMEFPPDQLATPSGAQRRMGGRSRA